MADHPDINFVESLCPVLSQTPMGAMLRVMGLLRHVMEPYFAQHGLSGAQFGILKALERAEQQGQKALRMKDLAGWLVVRPPSISGLVARLEWMGLLKRGASQEDQRSIHVKLTAKGRKLSRKMSAGHEAWVHQVMGGLSAAEQRQLRQLLIKLGDKIVGLSTYPKEPSSTKQRAKHLPAKPILQTHSTKNRPGSAKRSRP